MLSYYIYRHISPELNYRRDLIDANGYRPTYTETKLDDGSFLRVSEYLSCSISFYDSAGKNNHITDAPTAKSLAQFKLRGNSSIMFDKPPYKVNLVNEDKTGNKNIAVLGMPKHDKWILNGPYLDKTLLRNYLCMNISGEIMKDTPEVRFCELIVNGQYQGLYLVMESIEQGEERVPISKYKPGDPFISYLIRSDRDVSQVNKLNNFTKYSARRPKSTALEVLYPSIENQTPQVIEYIEQDISKFEKALYSLDYKDDSYGNQNFIDTGSFVDYFIINEFFQNTDAGVFSTYFYKDVKGKIMAGPVWDFNNACNNFIDISHPTDGFYMTSYPIFDMLIMDPDFTEAVIARYKLLRSTALEEQYLMGYIDDTILWLGSAVDRNYSVWGDSFNPSAVDGANKLAPDARNPLNYNQAVAQLKQFIIERGAWLDQNIEILRQFSHESKTKKHNR